MSVDGYLKKSIDNGGAAYGVWDARADLREALMNVRINPSGNYINLASAMSYSGYKQAFASDKDYRSFRHVADYALMYYQNKYNPNMRMYIDSKIYNHFGSVIKQWHVATTPMGHGKLLAMLKSVDKYVSYQR